MSNEYEVIDRLRRIETKLVRFAEELGIDTDVQRNWLTVDAGVIYVSTLGRSMAVMRMEAVRQGAKAGNFYDVVHKGDVCAKLFVD